MCELGNPCQFLMPREILWLKMGIIEQVFLFLVFISTDTALASSHHPCGGNVSLDQHLAGRISLTASEPFSSTTTTSTVIPLNATSDQSNQTLRLSACTWMISIPPGRSVLFKLLWLESGSSATVRCRGKDRVLEIDESTLLTDCGGHKASLSWTGEGHSSNPIELSYYGKKVSLDYPVWKLIELV